MARSVKFYELKLSSYIIKINNSKQNRIPVSKTPTIQELSQLLITAQKNNKTPAKPLFIKGTGANKFYLADALIENNKLFLLINRSDSTEPDPTISNPEDGGRDVLEKPPGFGNDYSAHAAISFNQISNKSKTYNLVFETARGSSIYGNHIHSFVLYLFKTLIKKNRNSFTTDDPEGETNPDGTPIQRNIQLKTELLGVINDELFKDIDGGKLEEIELIDNSCKIDYFDSGKMTKQVSAVITLNVEGSPKSSLSFLDVLSKNTKAPKEYDTMRIRFKDKTDTDQAALLDRETLMLADGHKYVKRKYIDHEYSSNYGFEKIQGPIKNELNKLI